MDIATSGFILMVTPAERAVSLETIDASEGFTLCSGSRRDYTASAIVDELLWVGLGPLGHRRRGHVHWCSGPAGS